MTTSRLASPAQRRHAGIAGAGWRDVYERSGGLTSLVSTGPTDPHGPTNAFFNGASSDGARVFFYTPAPLVSGVGDRRAWRPISWQGDPPAIGDAASETHGVARLQLDRRWASCGERIARRMLPGLVGARAFGAVGARLVVHIVDSCSGGRRAGRCGQAYDRDRRCAEPGDAVVSDVRRPWWGAFRHGSASGALVCEVGGAHRAEGLR